ncbi:MAG: hypothetical protein SV760_08895 [Halobacteria archaeon]|nr:hypothetical protein [Halobacteria archaeon]
MSTSPKGSHPDCPHCGEPVRGSSLCYLSLEPVVNEVEVLRRGLLVCPHCERVLGAYSDYEREDMEYESSQEWERIRSFEDI